MTERTYKVGDVVAWADVPDGAMVRLADKRQRVSWLAFQPRRVFLVQYDSAPWVAPSEGDDRGLRDAGWTRKAWDRQMEGAVVIIVALDLTGQETADDLQRLAELYEVREAVNVNLAVWRVVMVAAGGDDERGPTDVSLAQTIERLHTLGWRKDQTAEDAARLLAEH